MSEERYRLVVLGPPKVGKTSIIRQYLYKQFSEKYKETIEDLHSRVFRIHGTPLHLDILDTSFNFPDMRKVAISSANAFLLVFAVDDVQSFKEMSDIWSEIGERRSDIRQVPSVVVGNKSDLNDKKIFDATANSWTSRLNANVRYIEASAKNRSNIVSIFKTLLDLSDFVKPVGEKSAIAASISSGIHLLTLNDSPLITTPGFTDGGLKRHVSLRVHSSREKEKNKLQRHPSDESVKRSGSIIRRTKHLSIKKTKHNGRGCDTVDESDCNIS
ncbi:hypothetical protein AB6A40_003675 [Gnathostoma spinigerum]|uniref:Uncharacterized protein n=1 Tax=Gnathostoma spinigerum TaxID=75299 RepID=A0ABD6ECP1_9BILA